MHPVQDPVHPGKLILPFPGFEQAPGGFPHPDHRDPGFFHQADIFIEAVIPSICLRGRWSHHASAAREAELHEQLRVEEPAGESTAVNADQQTRGTKALTRKVRHGSPARR